METITEPVVGSVLIRSSKPIDRIDIQPIRPGDSASRRQARRASGIRQRGIERSSAVPREYSRDVGVKHSGDGVPMLNHVRGSAPITFSKCADNRVLLNTKDVPAKTPVTL